MLAHVVRQVFLSGEGLVAVRAFMRRLAGMLTDVIHWKEFEFILSQLESIIVNLKNKI